MHTFSRPNLVFTAISGFQGQNVFSKPFGQTAFGLLFRDQTAPQVQNLQNPRSSFRRPFAALPWVLPRPHELFLLGFDTAIWHFRSATSCFYWASKLLSGTFSAPLKSFKTLKTLPAAFDGLSLLCHGSSRGPTSSFCWASTLLSGTSEAPQAVSIGLRNCYLARFQHPLKASKPSKPSQQLSMAFFAALPWVLPRPHRLFLLGFETAIWHFRSATSCFYWASKLLSSTFSAPLKTLKTLKTFAAAFDGLLSGTFSALLKSFKTLETLKTLPAQLSTAFRCFAMGPPEAPRAVSVGLRHCYLALPRRPQAVSIVLRNCYLARFQLPLKPSKASKPRHAFVPLKVVRSTFGHLDVKGHIDVKVRERPCLVGSGHFWLEPRKFSAASCGHIRGIWGTDIPA